MAATSELGTRVPRKAKAVLDKLVGSRAMTQSGMEWLVCATDPFHDDRVRCPGYPDLSTVNSVVQTYTTTTSISAPSGQTAPWDLHVPFVPVSPAVVGIPPGVIGPINPVETWSNGSFYSTASNVPLFPGFNAIIAGVSGSDWLTTSASAAMTNSPIIAIPPKFMSGHSRCIAAGLELVNTTSQLYKGGALTVYRSPSTVEPTSLAYPTYIASGPPPLVLWSPVPMDGVSLPPTTQAEAAIYTDSRTWSAEDGAYVVVPMTDIENPYRSCNQPTDVIVRKALDYTTLNSYVSGFAPPVSWTSIYGGTPLSNATSHGSGCHALPFENCGAILTGLNPNSTIQATVRYYFERIPSTTEPDILSMAQVPPAYDGVALEIYSRCLAEMPIGVPQNENPLGEWFSGILETISNLAPKIGNFVSNLGNAISTVGNPPLPSSNATAQRNMNKQQKQQQQVALSRQGVTAGNPFMQNGQKKKKKKKKNKKQ